MDIQGHSWLDMLSLDRSGLAIVLCHVGSPYDPAAAAAAAHDRSAAAQAEYAAAGHAPILPTRPPGHGDERFLVFGHEIDTAGNDLGPTTSQHRPIGVTVRTDHISAYPDLGTVSDDEESADEARLWLADEARRSEFGPHS